MAGRPREFDYDTALEQAMHVFWRKGYEGTSMPDLTEAMGLNRPSIYASFGNKEELFRKAIHRYNDNAQKIFREALAAPKIKDAVGAFFCAAISAYSCKENPNGCLSVQGALVGSDDAESLMAETAKLREGIVALLAERLTQAKAEGELRESDDPATLARFFATVLNGMSVQSVGKMCCDTNLKKVAEHALSILPA